MIPKPQARPSANDITSNTANQILNQELPKEQPSSFAKKTDSLSQILADQDEL